MSDAGDFIRRALAFEGDRWRGEDVRERLGGRLDATGASVGAIRGTVRDALTKFRGLEHDDITALSSELWSRPVFEHRLAAIVLLQSRAGLLGAGDLTRLEGFLRDSRVDELAGPLARDVVRPLRDGLDDRSRSRADAVLDRWEREGGPLGAAAAIVRGRVSR